MFAKERFGTRTRECSLGALLHNKKTQKKKKEKGVAATAKVQGRNKSSKYWGEVRGV